MLGFVIFTLDLDLDLAFSGVNVVLFGIGVGPVVAVVEEVG